MQQKINEKHQQFHDEVNMWQVEIEEVKRAHKYPMDTVKLNIGGTHHLECDKDLLTSC